jgi:hypothetical protein
VRALRIGEGGTNTIATAGVDHITVGDDDTVKVP